MDQVLVSRVLARHDPEKQQSYYPQYRWKAQSYRYAGYRDCLWKELSESREFTFDKDPSLRLLIIMEKRLVGV